MTLSNDERIEVIKKYMERADERLSESKKLLSSGLPGYSVRASYEAAYNSTVALFVSYGKEIPGTHSGLNRVFHNDFVSGGKIFPASVAKHLGALESDRNTDQYNVSKKISDDTAVKDIAKAEEFLASVRPVIEKRLEYMMSLPPDAPELAVAVKIRDLGLLPGDHIIHTNPSMLVKYQGLILYVATDAGFSVRQTAPKTLVVHRHDAIERIPEKGENLQIVYRPSRKGEVKTLEHENKNTLKL